MHKTLEDVGMQCAKRRILLGDGVVRSQGKRSQVIGGFLFLSWRFLAGPLNSVAIPFTVVPALGIS